MQDKGYQEIRQRLAAFDSPGVVNDFFDLLARLINHLRLSPNDPRLALYVRNDYRKRFTVNVGTKLALALSNANDLTTVQFRIKRSRFPVFAERLALIDVFGNEMKNEDEIVAGVEASSFFANPDESLVLDWLKTCEERLPAKPGNASNEHYPLMWEMALNEEARRQVFNGNNVSSSQSNKTVKYYVVGAIWNNNGSGDDRTSRFIKDGVWINAKNEAQYTNATKSIEAGDRLAIKAAWADPNEKVGYLRIKAIGTVTKNHGDGERVEVSWDTSGRPFDLSGELSRYRKTIEQVEDEEHIQAIFFHQSNGKSGSDKALSDAPLNQILYGPPGTGKTYHSITKAAYILAGKELSDTYSEAKAIYKGTLGDQIEFITFHQNYSYEDFIVGLRPNTENGEQLTFEKHKGIFYRLCQRARENYQQASEGSDPIPVFDEALAALREQIDSNEPLQLSTPGGRRMFTLQDYNDSHIEYKRSTGTIHQLSIASLREFYEGSRINSNNGPEIYHEAVANKLKAIAANIPNSGGAVPLKPYVLIIDEINRANISRVFGELITLLEEDKRLGNDHAMEISLPNGERFSVPKNLYIIGTMNTADKSIALLDIALRRRFQFIPMYPNEALVSNPTWQAFLKSLNAWILDAKGADFLVGHAYFLSNRPFEELMNRQIIPLLNEYFYNDGADTVLKLLANATQVPGYKFEKDAYLGVTCKDI